MGMDREAKIAAEWAARVWAVARRLYVVRWHGARDARGQRFVLYWVPRGDLAFLIENGWTKTTTRFSLRAWWELQRRELARWAGVWVRWLEKRAAR